MRRLLPSSLTGRLVAIQVAVVLATTLPVAVVTSREDPQVVLWVQDDGPGLPPDLVDSAFERFTCGDSARTRKSGGAGLGLSLVEAITTAHGGSASVRSQPGCTVFEVRLPAERQPQPPCSAARV